MNIQLDYMIVQQRSAELRRAGEQARLAAEAPARRRTLRDPNPITRPSAEPRRGRTALEVKRAIGGRTMKARGGPTPTANSRA
jgi:hypothetical protein